MQRGSQSQRSELLKNSFRKFALLFLCLALAGCAALLTPKLEERLIQLKQGSYALDKSHAVLLFKVQHMGLSTYVGRFNQIDATLEFDPQNLEQTRLTAIVDMGSIDINNESLEKDLKGRKWFNVAEYPQAEFTTLDVIALNENQFEFVGELNWRGFKQPVTLMATFHGGANNILTGKYTLGFFAEGKFDRSDFGMSAFIPLVGDQTLLEGHAEFQRN